jgi:hypothetical protein
MNALLRCEIYPGQFSSEYAVILRSFTGKEFSLFASRQDVQCDDRPTDEQPSEGWLRVAITKRDGSLCLVRLPQSTIENGQSITVNADQLKITEAPKVAHDTLESGTVQRH